MTNERYNGWSNYETWAVNLWMTNDEAGDVNSRKLAQECWDLADANRDRMENAASALANKLKEQHEEAIPDLGCTLWTDLLDAAMSEVDWYEIAKGLLEDVDKEEVEEIEA